jgi:hypothetical protein
MGMRPNTNGHKDDSECWEGNEPPNNINESNQSSIGVLFKLFLNKYWKLARNPRSLEQSRNLADNTHLFTEHDHTTDSTPASPDETDDCITPGLPTTVPRSLLATVYSLTT